jgi:branched-chain amino acid transport system permease protein
VNSPFGYVLRGIRESETRMLALGYNVWRYKFVAFVVAGTFAGLAGCLYAYLNRYVSPNYVHVVMSAEVLLMVVLGGAGTLFGPAIGAVLFVWLENMISGYTERWLIALGVIYVLVGMFAPNGLLGLVRDFGKRRAGS